jgi:hypothetical protein
VLELWLGFWLCRVRVQVSAKINLTVRLMCTVRVRDRFRDKIMVLI